MRKILFIIIAAIMLLGLFSGCTGTPPINVIDKGQDGDEQDRTTDETGEPVDTSALRSIEYPEAIAFDDYEKKRQVRGGNAVDENILQSINDFSFNSSAKVLADADGNACYSPISLYMALALLTSGTDGEVQDELTALLGEEDTAYLSEQMGKLFRRMYTNNEISKLYMTNSLWINEEYPVKKEYTDNAMENFYAAVNNIDFSDPGAGGMISQWISDNTEGLLKPQMNVNPEYLMYIVNTIYLNDEWSDNFEEAATREDIFNLSSGQSVNTQFMNKQFGTSINQADGYTAASLYMKNTGRMVLVLPDEGVDVNSFLASPELLAEMIDTEKERYAMVEMSLPKFDFDSKFDLEKSLKSLGIEKAFDADSGGFSGISDYATFISEVKQGSKIAIDENGVEAAAYTYIAVDTAAADMPDEPIVLKFDRPFIFIVQSDAGVPLFIGTVQNPVE